MARDLEAELKQKREEVDRFTKGSYTYNPTADVASRTKGVLSKALSESNRPEGEIVAARETAEDKLGKEAGRKFAAQRLGQDREKYNLMFNTLVNRALAAKYSYQQAIQYAQQTMMTQMQQEFQAGEAEKDRASGTRIFDLKGDVTQQRIALRNEFTPQTDYEAALIRATTGTVGAVGAYSAYRSGREGTTTPKTNFYNPFSRPDELYKPGNDIG